MKHILFLMGREAGWVGWLFFFSFIFLVHYFFPDIKVNMSEQSGQAELFMGHLLKVILQNYQHYVASAVSLNIQQLWKHGSSIHGAIIRCNSKTAWIIQSCVWNSTVILTMMWPLRHYVNLKMAIFLVWVSAVCLFVCFFFLVHYQVTYCFLCLNRNSLPKSQRWRTENEWHNTLHKGQYCVALKFYRHVSCD